MSKLSEFVIMTEKKTKSSSGQRGKTPENVTLVFQIITAIFLIAKIFMPNNTIQYNLFSIAIVSLSLSIIISSAVIKRKFNIILYAIIGVLNLLSLCI